MCPPYSPRGGNWWYRVLGIWVCSTTGHPYPPGEANGYLVPSTEEVVALLCPYPPLGGTQGYPALGMRETSTLGSLYPPLRGIQGYLAPGMGEELCHRA